MVFLNLILLAFHHKLLIEFLRKILDQLKTGKKYLKLEWAINLVLIGFVTFMISSKLLHYIDQRNFLTGDWYNDKPHYWVQKGHLNKNSTDSSKPQLFASDLKLYFHPDNDLIKIQDDIAKPIRLKYKLDTENKLLTIYSEKDSTTKTTGTYEQVRDDTLIWKIEADSTVELIKKSL